MRNIWRLLTPAVIAATFAVSGSLLIKPLNCHAQEAMGRKVKTRVSPVYPDIARRMNISGTVRLSVVVATNGVVKNTTAMGGHPILVNAAMDAVKKWKFEPATAESTGTVEFKFAPENN